MFARNPSLHLSSTGPGVDGPRLLLGSRAGCKPLLVGEVRTRRSGRTRPGSPCRSLPGTALTLIAAGCTPESPLPFGYRNQTRSPRRRRSPWRTRFARRTSRSSPEKWEGVGVKDRELIFEDSTHSHPRPSDQKQAWLGRSCACGMQITSCRLLLARLV